MQVPVLLSALIPLFLLPSNTAMPRLSQSPFQFFSAVRKYAGKGFSHLQRAKSTGGFFDRGVIGGLSLF